MPDYKAAYKTIMDDHFPETMTVTFGDMTLSYRKRTWKIADDSGEVIEKGLRYGENPGQEAALYELVGGNLTLGDCKFIEPGRGLVSCLAEDQMLQFGKHPGKTNLTDVDNALNMLKFLMDTPAAVVMKHNNPSGAAKADSIADAYEKANMADRIAAFGGAVVLNRACDMETAKLIAENYCEVVAAPDYAPGAVDVLKGRKNLRIIQISQIERLAAWRDQRFVDFKCLIDGGIIVQQSPLNKIASAADFQPAFAKRKGVEYKCERQPTDKEMDDLLFGWSVEQGITSNSVIYCKDGVTIGIGTGEQDRVGVAEIAVYKAYTKHRDALCFREHGVPFYELTQKVNAGDVPAAKCEELEAATKEAHGGLVGAVAVSDAFFPSPDGIDVIIAEGVTAIVQPGGSIADWNVITHCNAADPKVAMVFTGQRAFKH